MRARLSLRLQTMKKQNNAPDPSEMDDGQSFVSHLLELRDRLLRMVLAVLIIFLCLFYFSNDLYSFIAGPLMAHLPEGSSMVAIEVASPFLTPFKLTMVLSIFLAMPIILHQFWKFVAPGLYSHEKRLALPILATSILLFYLGMVFAYFVVFPLVFAFFTSTAPEGVAIMTDISKYLDFVLTVFFAFGIAFEVPIATILLVWGGVTTPKALAAKRPYIIVGAFVVGMVLTPPDVISQTLLAVPMWALFELGVIFSRFYVRRSDEEESQPAEAAAAATTGAAEADTEPYHPMSDQELEDEFERVDREMEALARSGETDSGSTDRGEETDRDPDRKS